MQGRVSRPLTWPRLGQGGGLPALAARGVRGGAVVAHEMAPGARDLNEDPGHNLRPRRSSAPVPGRVRGEVPNGEGATQIYSSVSKPAFFSKRRRPPKPLSPSTAAVIEPSLLITT